MRVYVRRLVCWLLGHHPVGPPFYSPMCARCGLILHDNCTAWGDDPAWDAHVEAMVTQGVYSNYPAYAGMGKHSSAALSPVRQEEPPPEEQT